MSDENKDITLPYELALKNLSLKEIGAIFVMFAFLKMDEDEMKTWVDNDEYYETINNLLEHDVVKVNYDENEKPISVEIDLTEKEFWTVETFDDNDNPIYSHPAVVGDEGTPYEYRVKPILQDMQIIWQDCSDGELNVAGECFVDLKEAEEFYKECIKSDTEALKLENN